jgi:hypothetical protein
VTRVHRPPAPRPRRALLDACAIGSTTTSSQSATAFYHAFYRENDLFIPAAAQHQHTQITVHRSTTTHTPRANAQHTLLRHGMR